MNVKSYVLYQIVPLSMTLSDHEPSFKVIVGYSFKANILQTAHLIHSMFGSRLRFSVSEDGPNSNIIDKNWTILSTVV